MKLVGPHALTVADLSLVPIPSLPQYIVGQPLSGWLNELSVMYHRSDSCTQAGNEAKWTCLARNAAGLVPLYIKTHNNI